MPHLFQAILLHAGGIDPTGWLWSDWNVEPTIGIGLLALVAGYLFLTRAAATGATVLPSRLPSPPALSPVEPGGRALVSSRETTNRQKAAFIAGLITLFVALGPPLDDWSDHYLLTAHMIQHMLLVLLAAPLLLSGTPAWLLEPLTRNRWTNAIGYWLTRPLLAFALANLVFVLWHVPVLYETALSSQPVHVLEHVTLLGTALLAWWPILGPLPQWPRLPMALQSIYLFAMTIPSSGVGAFITFADPGLYAPYDTAPRIFGIDLATDQQVAGLFMWVAVSAIYLVLITVVFFRWAAREEAAERPNPAVSPIHRDAGTRIGG